MGVAQRACRGAALLAKAKAKTEVEADWARRDPCNARAEFDASLG